MVEKKQKKKILLVIASVSFILIELVLAIMIQTVLGDINKYICYASVVTACLFFLLFAERTWVYALTQLALVMTVCADFFLVLIPDMRQVTAMVFFSIAQLAYFMRLYFSEGSRKIKKIHLFCRAGTLVTALIITAVVLGKHADMLSFISMFYFANLFVNIVFAFARFKTNYLFAIGLLLFACCDLLIGFSFLEDYLEISSTSLIYRLAHPGFNFAWVFYVPSQAFIAMSLLPKKVKK